MGNTESVQNDSSGPPPTTTHLYKMLQAGGRPSWVLISEDAQPNIYDSNQDSQRRPEWHLELEGCQEAPDIVIDDTLEFQQPQRRCVFLGDGTVWALAFPNDRSFSNFMQKYNRALFENNYGLEQNEDNELNVFGTDFMSFHRPEPQESREEWVEDMDVDRPSEAELMTPSAKGLKKETPEKICGVVLGATDRSFVLKESGVNVMKNVQGGLLDTEVDFSFDVPQYQASMTPTRTPTRAQLTPKSGRTPGSTTPTLKAILMNSETKMNILSPGDSAVKYGDLETGKIVRELAFQKDNIEIPMLDITTDSKTAQLEDHNTFLALDTNRIARFDVRDPSGLVQNMSSPATLSYVEGKDYSRYTNFTCMATSGDGYVVVGSKDGKVRLYSDKSLKQAKTAFPGLGAPITSVAVSFDGKWVLATTNHYIMVIKTIYKDSSGKELCGFTSKMGAKAPSPRLLRLSPFDNAKANGAPLEKAHFTWITEKNEQERWVVASCGKYTALWNFRQVKLADPESVSYSGAGLTTIHAHRLDPKGEHIVDSLFMHEKFRPATGNNEDAMVVVTDSQVYTNLESDY